jgi:hypothetical protein
MDNSQVEDNIVIRAHPTLGQIRIWPMGRNNVSIPGSVGSDIRQISKSTGQITIPQNSS